jgi:hypothetical protein
MRALTRAKQTRRHFPALPGHSVDDLADLVRSGGPPPTPSPKPRIARSADRIKSPAQGGADRQ